MAKHDYTKPLMIHARTDILGDGVIEWSLDITGTVYRTVFKTQDAQIREALVALGWTPPATDIAATLSDTPGVASPGQDEADEPLMGRPIRAVVELPPGACTEKELVNRLRDILRFPIKVYAPGGYRKFKPEFKSFSRVMQAERRRG